MLKYASWNVNSLKVRLPQVLDWIKSAQIDVLGLQETKMTDDVFPKAAFEDLGYHVVFSGQKTYNGVAVVSRYPIHDVVVDVPDFLDPQRRVMAVTIEGIRMINLYVPNGAAVDSEKYAYKLNWLQKVSTWIQSEMACHRALLVMGDFNIAPQALDVHDESAWQGQVLVSPAERDAFKKLQKLGLHDAFRCLHPDEVAFSWWDYRAAGFRRDLGLRIDHVLLSEALFQRCVAAGIDKEPRRSERPSDHAPVFVLIK